MAILTSILIGIAVSQLYVTKYVILLSMLHSVLLILFQI